MRAVLLTRATNTLRRSQRQLESEVINLSLMTIRKAANWVLIVLGLCSAGACGSVNVEEGARAYYRRQASDYITAYEGARSQGDAFKMCVIGNQVSAAYRDAKDPADAGAWDVKRSEDCQSAVGTALVPAQSVDAEQSR